MRRSSLSFLLLLSAVQITHAGASLRGSADPITEKKNNKISRRQVSRRGTMEEAVVGAEESQSPSLKEDLRKNIHGINTAASGREYSTNIVGGSKAAPDRYGYFTSIYQLWQGENFHVCGGSLIHTDLVITAAHCAQNAESVRIGSYTNIDLSTNGGARYHESKVVAIAQHPQFHDDDLHRLHYDFALLKLEHPVPGHFADSIVKLDIDGRYANALRMGDVVSTMGLGTLTDGGDGADYLQEVDLNFISRDTCDDIFHGGIDGDMMCAKAHMKDACIGDSGGPLVLASGDGADSDIQIGIVSWGSGCASQYPGVYSCISHVGDWLKEKICELTEVPSARYECHFQMRGDIVENRSTVFENQSVDDASSGCEDLQNCSWIERRSWPAFWCTFNAGKCQATCGMCGL